ncbi:cadherin-like beta sandwich domain-containing protein, partial [Wukongibacter baidiensis]
IEGGSHSNGAFIDCVSLESIDLPMIETIESYTFYGCTALANLTLGETPPSVGTNAFFNCPDTRTIKVPVVDNYRNDSAGYDVDTDLWYGWTLYEVSDDATLSNLTISSGSLSPVFDSDTRDYTVEVSNDISSIDISPTANHSNAIITVEGDTVASGDTVNVALSVGSNEINVVVTAEDGSTTDETIIRVTRASSNDTTLSNLTISSGSLSPVFDSDTRDYTVEVSNDISSIDISPTANHSNAIITVEGDTVASGDTVNVALSVGSNEINVVVTAEDGSTTDETIIRVTRASSNDTTLSNLTISSGSLSPVFDSNTRDYTVEVNNDISSMDIRPTANHSSATITVEGDTVASGDTVNVPLSVGTNEINVVVTAEDGSTTDETIIRVTRASSNDTTLSNLTISSGSLSPVFDSNTRDYTVEVSNDISSIDISPTANHSNTTITVEGDTVASGDTVNVALSVGTNEINVVVTAEDGSTTDETIIRVTRASSNDTTLSNLTISSGSLSPVFDSNTRDYTVEVSNDISSIDISLTANHSNATITVEGDTVASGDTVNVPLSVGENTITVEVTAEDASIETYTITVNRDAGNDATLSDLSISSGSLSPVFDSATTEYSASVTYSTTSVDITPTVNDSKATVTVEGKDVTSGKSENISLNVGDNEINIVVTAEDGSTTQTIVKVTRASYVPYTPSTNAYLRSLRLEGINLSPTFSLSTYNYEANVTSEIDTIKISAVVYDYKSKMEINGEAVSDSASKTIDLNPGKNIIKVKVTAEKSYYKKTYTITVNKELSEVEQAIEEAEDIEALKEIYEDINDLGEEEKQSLLKQITEKAFEMMEDLSEIDFIQSVIDDMKEGEIKEEYEIRLGGKEMIYGEEYNDWDEHKETEQPINKVWNVKFNFTLDEETIVAGDDYITVVDEDGYRIEIELEYEKESKTLKIKPIADYEPGKKYYLILGTELRNEEGVLLKEPIRLEFVIETDN